MSKRHLLNYYLSWGVTIIGGANFFYSSGNPVYSSIIFATQEEIMDDLLKQLLTVSQVI
jgi:hypothetical protein